VTEVRASVRLEKIDLRGTREGEARFRRATKGSPGWQGGGSKRKNCPEPDARAKKTNAGGGEEAPRNRPRENGLSCGEPLRDIWSPLT